MNLMMYLTVHVQVKRRLQTFQNLIHKIARGAFYKNKNRLFVSDIFYNHKELGAFLHIIANLEWKNIFFDVKYWPWISNDITFQ